MTIIYHLVPREVVGGTLLPLNQLRDKHPDVYAKQVRKYEGREQLLSRRIPLLDCLWNDVLFLSNVHPKVIRDEFLEVGQTWRVRQWYAVDTGTCGFNESNAVIYYPATNREKGDFTVNPEQFVPFNEQHIDQITAIPSATMKHYRQAVEIGSPIFAWWGLPHILHRGALPIADLRIIDV